MKTHQYRIRARYSEVDAMGRVHNSRYLVYFEEARTDLVRDLGYPYARIEEEGLIMPMSEAGLKFSKPIAYDEEVTVEVSLGYLRNHSVRFEYILRRADGEVASTGFTIHAVINVESGDFAAVSDELRHVLTPYVAEKKKRSLR